MSAASGKQNGARRGVAVIIVLAILSITLALSYSVMRTQVTAVQIQTNSMRRDKARQAAVAGISTALQQMHQSSWAGVDVPLASTLDANSGFEVGFVTGDSSLAPGDADYHLWPYRVTISSTGYAADPANAQLRSLHTVRVVVQLAPRSTAARPSGWDLLQDYTVYQWKPSILTFNSRFNIEVPARIEGPVRVQGALKLCDDYPGDYDARLQLLGDLQAMQLNDRDDHRPFDDTVSLPYSFTSSSTRSLLTNQLGVSIINLGQDSSADFSLPGNFGTYRLYPGGQEYSVQVIGGLLLNETLEADPETNPLGLFYRNGLLEILDNVTIRGTLIVEGGSIADIRVRGSNVQLEAVNLPPLYGTDEPIQLPVVMAPDDLEFYTGCSATIDGLVVVEDEFEVDRAAQDAIDLTVAGRVICREMLIESRHEWDKSNSWYEGRHSDFLDQSSFSYFPTYLQARDNLVAKPRINIKPPADEVTFHWQSTSDPVYAVHIDDAGLMWDMIDWQDNP